ncbi:MAG: RDD family protein [Bauldia litoralis]
MTYPQWWERLLAAVIDAVILAIIVFIINAIFGALAGFNLTMLRIMLLIAVLVNTAIIVGYKVFFESGTWQATPGKMVFGIKVGDAAGARAPMQQVLMRTWPWWLNLIGAIGALTLAGTAINLLIALAMIAIFCTFFMAPQGRCIHDKTANLHVIKAGKGMISQ